MSIIAQCFAVPTGRRSISVRKNASSPSSVASQSDGSSSDLDPAFAAIGGAHVGLAIVLEGVGSWHGAYACPACPVG